MAKQTLKQALYLARSGKSSNLAIAANALTGKPEGGWPETAQAMRLIAEMLPARDSRDYGVYDFVDAAYEVRSLNGSYYPREQ